MKKLFLLLIVICLSVFLPSCKNSEQQFINLVDYLHHFTLGHEENNFDFTRDESRDLRYLLKGFKRLPKKAKKIRAIRQESSLTVFSSELLDTRAAIHCRPLNPRGKPCQEADIFVNNVHLKKLVLLKTGEYFFDIPASRLTYGSNTITLKWKYLRSPKGAVIKQKRRKYAAEISYIRFLNKPERLKRFAKVFVDRKNQNSGIAIPYGSISEYYVNLPAQPTFRFKLSSGGKAVKGAKLYLAIYNEKGRKRILQFDKSHFNSSEEHAINLSEFSQETVKIVFASSIRNHPNFTVSVVNPVLYAAGANGLFTAGGEKNKKIRQHKKTGKAQPGGKRPNVFIYLVDTLRADHLGCYGYFRETTPYIDRFAKSGILFEKCFANASWTRAAVASVLTGLYPNKHRAEGRKDQLSAEVNTLSEILKPCGYTTFFITTNGNVSNNFNFNQGNDFFQFLDIGENREDHVHSSEHLNRRFRELLEERPEFFKKPVFAFLHTIDPHDPYTPESPFLKFKKDDPNREHLCFPKEILQKKKKTGLSREDLDYIQSLYDCEILHNDHFFGEWITFLKEKKLFDNSLIIFVSDHGEQFYEHGGMFHGHSIYNEEIHVPLIVKFPAGRYSGRQCSAAVSQVDILPTILDYLGIDMPAGIDGISLLDLLEDTTIKRSIFIKEALDITRMIGFIDSNREKNIFTYQDELFSKPVKFETFNLVTDFHETANLFEKMGLFRAKSVEFLADYFSIEMNAAAYRKEVEVDIDKLAPDVLKQLKALGYLE